MVGVSLPLVGSPMGSIAEVGYAAVEPRFALESVVKNGSASWHLSRAELDAGLDHIRRAPRDAGELQAIVIRPRTEERVSLQKCLLTPAGGVQGDNWSAGCWLTLPDGSPHPNVQVAMMNARVIDLVAQVPQRWELAGDNLYVDLDLSEDNLTAGDQLRIGEALLEVTEEAHNGCAKFARRFGKEALQFVNSAVGEKLHLRGVYAKIVEPGIVRVGDSIRKVTSAEAQDPA